MDYSKHDIEILENRGLTIEKIEEELEMLRKGFPFLQIASAAMPENGITIPSDEMIGRSVAIWEKYIKGGGSVEKMVPASGAASRMFKELHSFLDSKDEKKQNDSLKRFFEEIELFAFFSPLNFLANQLYGKSIATLISEKRYKDVVSLVLKHEGLNYGKLPKALILFHKYLGYCRTPIEEHLAEGALYAASKNREVKIHFTVGKEHLAIFQSKIEEVKGFMEHLYDVKFQISYSVQKPATDTVSVTKEGELYRCNGEIFFRPGGHGALIENLNELESDVVFIKNIDNVVPDIHKEITVRYKKMLGGTLIATKKKLDDYCKILEHGDVDESVIDEMIDFLHKVLHVSGEKTSEMTHDEKVEFLFSKFNRPLRVCGMVKNEGEPGGGPFMVYSPDGTLQPQILESSQINPKDLKKLFKEATHFNPVDLVCAIKDYKGNKFNLPEFVDKTTGFISEKSHEGIEIKALELPGLWNGSMSNWNTIFVEVPIETFNPVKTVNDLLRQMHQP